MKTQNSKLKTQNWFQHPHFGRRLWRNCPCHLDPTRCTRRLNGGDTEVGSWKLEVGSWKLEVGNIIHLHQFIVGFFFVVSTYNVPWYFLLQIAALVARYVLYRPLIQ
jgi:hypothetical protein